MATIEAKKSARKVSKPSVTLNHSAAWQVAFEFGETAGRAAQAKLQAALKFQELVAKGEIDVSDKDKRKAAIADYANGYDAGQAAIPGNRPMSAGTLEGLRTEFGSFIREEVIGKAADGYAMIADILKGKKSEEIKFPDQYQQRLEINRAIAKAAKEGKTATKADFASRILKQPEEEQTAKEKRDAAIKKLLKDAREALAAKLGWSKDQKQAFSDLIAALS